MAAKKSGSYLSAAVLLTAVAALMLTGCSSQSPVAPTSEPVAEVTPPQVLSRTPIAAAALGTPVPMYTEVVVKAAEGGHVQLFDVVLDIPAGALDNDTTYSILIPDVYTFYNEFGTDGLVFKQPVTVTMSYRDADLTGIDESSIRIGWWDAEHSQWVDMNCQLDKVNQVVIGQLYHFSAYALVSD